MDAVAEFGRGLGALVAEALALDGEFIVLLDYYATSQAHLDRFSREGVLETLNHLKRLSSYGVGYRTFTEQYLDSCGIFKDAVLSILATIAKQERIRLSERTIAGLEKARKQGRVGGRPRVVVNRAKVVEMDADGMTMREIADDLGISAASVCRILKGNATAA
jgi:DNA invertase Pin-like site-specific DNA recombinase